MWWCEPESLVFDGHGDAMLPTPHERCSHSYCSIVETEHVVVGREGATAPGGNSSAESVAPSSSTPQLRPTRPDNDEPFMGPPFEFPEDSDNLNFDEALRVCRRRAQAGAQQLRDSLGKLRLQPRETLQFLVHKCQ